METLQTLKNRISDASKDTRLNLGSILERTGLSRERALSVALAAAIRTQSHPLQQAVVAKAQNVLSEGSLQDAEAAATLMSMNNVYYRFRHFMGQNGSKSGYDALAPGLRMNHIARPQADKLDFELMCLAVSAMGGCEVCVQSHEAVVRKGGLSEQDVHDAVRIAAVIQAAATALEASAARALGKDLEAA